MQRVLIKKVKAKEDIKVEVTNDFSTVTLGRGKTIITNSTPGGVYSHIVGKNATLIIDGQQVKAKKSWWERLRPTARS